MKKRLPHKSIFEEENDAGEINVRQNNDTYENKVYKARISYDKPQALHAGIKLFESRFIIDPRDGNIKLTNNPILLMHDMIKRTFDGSVQFVNVLGEELSIMMNACDEYIWIEEESGEIKGI